MNELVYGYVRVSSKGQVDGDGPDRQRDAIEKFCAKNSLQLAEHFTEEGVSGTTEALDRPEFSRMMDHMENGDVAVIVVERMDRLARDLMVSELLLRACREKNIKVYCVDQGDLTNMAADSEDPTRTLIRQIMGSLAQWEKSVLVRKLRLSRERMKEKTGRCEGRKAYGEKPGERQVMHLIQDMLGHSPSPNGLTFGGVAGILNDSGFKTRCGKPWTRVSVRTVWTTNKMKGK